jgi:hypothetical protein
VAKESGIGLTFTLDNSSGAGQAITNDVTDCNFSTPRNSQDVTGLDKSGYERIQLLADFKCSANGVFNDAADMSHAVLKTMSSTSVIRTLVLAVSGQSLTNEVTVDDYAFSLANGTVPTWA